MRSLVFIALAMLVACGPSAAELKTAKTASYVGDPKTMFETVIATTGETYKVAEATQDGETYKLITAEQWYSPEGGRQSSGTGDYVQIDDRSIRLQLLVEMTSQTISDTRTRTMVVVTPVAYQHIAGSPQPRELKPDDPNLPGWVSGRVDSLHLAIHKSLQKYASQ